MMLKNPNLRPVFSAVSFWHVRLPAAPGALQSKGAANFAFARLAAIWVANFDWGIFR